MTYKKLGAAMVAALLISLSGEVAEASLWPGLASKVSENPVPSVPTISIRGPLPSAAPTW